MDADTARDERLAGIYPTVAEVLTLPAVRPGEPLVRAGSQHLDRPVRWTHAAEIADVARLLRGGELLLTTGVLLPDDDAGLAAWVDGLADAGVTGVFVETGRRFDRLPDGMVSRADGRGLVLVELSHEVPFASITEAVHARIVDAQLAELRSSDEVHATFTQLTVDGAPPTEIVRQVARMSGRPVVLENLAHQVLAVDAAGVDLATVLDSWEDRSRAVRVPERTAYDERSGWLVTTVGARGQDWGRLVLITAGAPTPRESMLIERGAATVALSRLVERDRESLERQSHRTLLTGLISGSVSTTETVTRAQALGVPLDGRALVAVLVRLADGPTGPALEAQERLRDFSETVSAAVRDTRAAALVGGVDDATVGVLLSLPPREDVDRALERLSAALTKRVGTARAVVPSDDWVMAVGSIVASVRDVRRAFLEAAQVADAAPSGDDGGARPYYRLPDVRLRGLLHLLRDDDRLQTFVERELGPLLAHDAQHGTDLVGVLRVHLAMGRNKSAAADAAHMSRPSFYERLHRIERVLQVDLDSVESCLSLHVALLGLDALRR
ncbi:MAG TPA: PucR family transcriptional regulator ligand-binding domain-containing protein [Candidatus Nanopelagicales bacterium]|nr:PucR family transcriptional regulator ligand-binding domain-containing protein [Candidatus Nanopelagicales bacterium]